MINNNKIKKIIIPLSLQNENNLNYNNNQQIQSPNNHENNINASIKNPKFKLKAK